MTVLEVLIFMTALAIAVLLTVPGFSRLIANHRLTSTSDELVQTVQTARREALKRHTTVRVCPSSDGHSCDGDDAWEQGWLVYADGNNDSVAQQVEHLFTVDPPPESVRIMADGAVRNQASFRLSGLVPENGSTEGGFLVCHLGSRVVSQRLTIEENGWVEITPASQKGCLP